MAKFKVGDKVRVVKAGLGCAPDKIGMLCIISHVDLKYMGDEGCYVQEAHKISGNSLRTSISVDTFELAEEEIERVEYTIPQQAEGRDIIKFIAKAVCNEKYLTGACSSEGGGAICKTCAFNGARENKDQFLQMILDMVEEKEDA